MAAAAKPPQPTLADTLASRLHDRVLGQFAKAFEGFSNDTYKHLAGVPLKERCDVFHDERKLLREKLATVLVEAGEQYTHIVIAYPSDVGTDPLKWVEAQLQADRDEITRERLEHSVGQAVWVDPSSNLPSWLNRRLLERPGRRLAEDVVELPEKEGKAVLGTIEAISVDLAGVDLAAALPLDDAEWVLKDIWAGLCLELREIMKGAIDFAQVELDIAAVPTSSNPINPDKHRTIGKQISEFDRIAGKLMVEARARSTAPKKKLPKSVIYEICDSIDSRQSFTPDEYLERKAKKRLNDHNMKHSRTTLKTFTAAAKHTFFHRAVCKRLYRAEEKYKKATGDVS